MTPDRCPLCGGLMKHIGDLLRCDSCPLPVRLWPEVQRLKDENAKRGRMLDNEADARGVLSMENAWLKDRVAELEDRRTWTVDEPDDAIVIKKEEGGYYSYSLPGCSTAPFHTWREAYYAGEYHRAFAEVERLKAELAAIANGEPVILRNASDDLVRSWCEAYLGRFSANPPVIPPLSDEPTGPNQ